MGQWDMPSRSADNEYLSTMCLLCILIHELILKVSPLCILLIHRIMLETMHSDFSLDRTIFAMYQQGKIQSINDFSSQFYLKDKQCKDENVRICTAMKFSFFNFELFICCLNKLFIVYSKDNFEHILRFSQIDCRSSFSYPLLDIQEVPRGGRRTSLPATQ